MTGSEQGTPVALVTGAGSGIGRTAAQFLAGRGYRVALVGRTRASLEQTGATLGGAEGQAWAAIVADVSTPEGAAGMIDETVRVFGRLDALVNNAGWTDRVPIAEASPDFVRTIFGVNALGPVWACARALPIMQAQGGGVVVNVASRATRDPFPGLGVYGAAKAAVQTLAKAIANEHAGDNIRAYCISPGAVETALLRSVISREMQPHAMDTSVIADAIVACVTGETDMESGETRFITEG